MCMIFDSRFGIMSAFPQLCRGTDFQKMPINFTSPVILGYILIKRSTLKRKPSLVYPKVCLTLSYQLIFPDQKYLRMNPSWQHPITGGIRIRIFWSRICFLLNPKMHSISSLAWIILQKLFSSVESITKADAELSTNRLSCLVSILLSSRLSIFPMYTDYAFLKHSMPSKSLLIILMRNIP